MSDYTKEDTKSSKGHRKGIEKLLVNSTGPGFLMKNIIEDENLSKKSRARILDEASVDNMAPNVQYSLNKSKRWEINSASELMNPNLEASNVACTAKDSEFAFSNKHFVKARHNFDDDSNINTVSVNSHRGNLDQKIVEKPVELEYMLSKPHPSTKIFVGSMFKAGRKSKSTTVRKQVHSRDYSDLPDELEQHELARQNDNIDEDDEMHDLYQPREKCYRLGDFVKRNSDSDNEKAEDKIDEGKVKENLKNDYFLSTSTSSFSSQLKRGPFETFSITCESIKIKSHQSWLNFSDVLANNPNYKFKWLNLSQTAFQLTVYQNKQSCIVITMSQQDWGNSNKKKHQIKVNFNGTSDVKLDISDSYCFKRWPNTYGLQVQVEDKLTWMGINTAKRPNHIKLPLGHISRGANWQATFGLQALVCDLMLCVEIETKPKRAYEEDCFANKLAEICVSTSYSDAMNNIGAVKKLADRKNCEGITGRHGEKTSDVSSEIKFEKISISDFREDSQEHTNEVNEDQHVEIDSINPVDCQETTHQVYEAISCQFCGEQRQNAIVTSSCGHSYCSECIRTAFNRSIDEKASPLMCLHEDCKEEYPLVLLASVFPMELVHFAVRTRIEKIASEKLPQLKTFVCPTGCGIGFINSTTSFNQIYCTKCSIAFCENCECKPHWPLTCSEIKTWDQKMDKQLEADKLYDGYWQTIVDCANTWRPKLESHGADKTIMEIIEAGLEKSKEGIRFFEDYNSWWGNMDEALVEYKKGRQSYINNAYWDVIKEVHRRRCDVKTWNEFRKVLKKIVDYTVRKNVEELCQAVLQVSQNGFAWLYLRKHLKNDNDGWATIKSSLTNLIQEETSIESYMYNNAKVNGEELEKLVNKLNATFNKTIDKIKTCY